MAQAAEHREFEAVGARALGDKLDGAVLVLFGSPIVLRGIEAQARRPFPMRALHVDGGSEFAAEYSFD